MTTAPAPGNTTPNGALAVGIHLEERIAGALLFRPDLADQLRRVKPEHFERPELCAIASAVAVERLTDPEAIMERIVLGGSHGAAEARQLLNDLADWALGAHQFNVALAVDDLLDRAHAREADSLLEKLRDGLRRRRHRHPRAVGRAVRDGRRAGRAGALAVARPRRAGEADDDRGRPRIGEKLSHAGPGGAREHGGRLA